jgi:hypothetical protein
MAHTTYSITVNCDSPDIACVCLNSFREYIANQGPRILRNVEPFTVQDKRTGCHSIYFFCPTIDALNSLTHYLNCYHAVSVTK